MSNVLHSRFTWVSLRILSVLQDLALQLLGYLRSDFLHFASYGQRVSFVVFLLGLQVLLSLWLFPAKHHVNLSLCP